MNLTPEEYEQLKRDLFGNPKPLSAKEYKKAHRALMDGAAAAIEEFGEDELERYADQHRARQYTVRFAYRIGGDLLLGEKQPELTFPSFAEATAYGQRIRKAVGLTALTYTVFSSEESDGGADDQHSGPHQDSGPARTLPERPCL